MLAAGASSRMGQPKALLPCRNGSPLALNQAHLLAVAGAVDVVIVLGCNVDCIVPKLEVPDIRIAYNPDWEDGRITSLQTGLRSVGSVRGTLILPVDTVGVKSATLSRVLEIAEQSNALAVRPAWQGTPGRVLWISGTLFNELLGIKPSLEFRLDAWIQDRQTVIPVDDEAIMRNINTPDDWAAILP